MTKEENAVRSKEIPRPGMFLLPTLGMGRLAITIPAILVGFILIDIGQMFDQPVGIMGQLRSAAQAVSAIGAVLMGAWSVQFKQKFLLLMGLGFLSVSVGSGGGEGEGLNSRRKKRKYGWEEGRVRERRGKGEWKAGVTEERARTMTEGHYKPKDLRRE